MNTATSTTTSTTASAGSGVITLRLRYFAALRETIGRSEEIRQVPQHIVNVSLLRAWLRQQSDDHARALAQGRLVRAALNQRMLSTQEEGEVTQTGVASQMQDVARLHDGDEVAFFPPVTGG